MSWRLFPWIAAIVAIFACLSGCASSPAAKIQSFTKADVEGALALAMAANDRNGVACWKALAQSGVLDQPVGPGVASGIELVRMAGPASVCGAILSPVMP